MYTGCITPPNSKAGGVTTKMIFSCSKCQIILPKCSYHFSYGRGVNDLGRAWQKISQRVGRAGDDCRDRYRHLSNRKYSNSGQLTKPFRFRSLILETGSWSKEEENNLKDIVETILSVPGNTNASAVMLVSRWETHVAQNSARKSGLLDFSIHLQSE